MKVTILFFPCFIKKLEAEYLAQEKNKNKAEAGESWETNCDKWNTSLNADTLQAHQNSTARGSTRGSTRGGSTLGPSAETPGDDILLIVERSVDTITPLLHCMTLQGMVYDILGVKNKCYEVSAFKNHRPGCETLFQN
jgi:hypothetical protein